MNRFQRVRAVGTQFTVGRGWCVRAATHTHSHPDEPKQMTTKHTMRVCHEQTAAYKFHSAFPSVEINSLARSVGSSSFHFTRNSQLTHCVFQFFFCFFFFRSIFSVCFFFSLFKPKINLLFFFFSLFEFVQFLFISPHHPKIKHESKTTKNNRRNKHTKKKTCTTKKKPNRTGQTTTSDDTCIRAERQHAMH